MRWKSLCIHFICILAMSLFAASALAKDEAPPPEPIAWEVYYPLPSPIPFSDDADNTITLAGLPSERSRLAVSEDTKSVGLGFTPFLNLSAKNARYTVRLEYVRYWPVYYTIKDNQIVPNGTTDYSYIVCLDIGVQVYADAKVTTKSKGLGLDYKGLTAGAAKGEAYGTYVFQSDGIINPITTVLTPTDNLVIDAASTSIVTAAVRGVKECLDKAGTVLVPYILGFRTTATKKEDILTVYSILPMIQARIKNEFKITQDKKSIMSISSVPL